MEGRITGENQRMRGRVVEEKWLIIIIQGIENELKVLV